MTPTDIPWSVPVTRHEVPDAGLHQDIAAGEAVRARVAALAGVRAMPQLEASFDVRRHGKDGLRVTGEVRARVAQTCVVSLEPMESDIAEPVDLVFLPKRLQSEPDIAEDVHLEVHPEGEDAPELLVNDTIDLGAIAAEFAVLGVDPYPRKPDAAFVAPVVEEDAAAHPFAALAALKKGPGKSDS
jgi:uncharacterized metal-binding protein YceD (DUF177 family)